MHDPNKIPETVRVVSEVSDDNPLGYIVINKDDLTDEHELFEEKKAEAAPAATVAPAWQPK